MTSMGKYIVTTQVYNKTYGVVMTRRVFKGEKAKAYEKAMRYAYAKAEKLGKSSHDFKVTIQGEDWHSAAKVNP